MYTVHTGNMELEWEKHHGYVALGVKDGDAEDDEAEPFWLELLCEMIKETDKQPEGSRLLRYDTDFGGSTQFEYGTKIHNSVI